MCEVCLGDAIGLGAFEVLVDPCECGAWGVLDEGSCDAGAGRDAWCGGLYLAEELSGDARILAAHGLDHLCEGGVASVGLCDATCPGECLGGIGLDEQDADALECCCALVGIVDGLAGALREGQVCVDDGGGECLEDGVA